MDIEPPRARPLEPCLPPTVLVTRINIVGRDLTVPTPGKGPQVFNLHVGIYRDPATGRLCGIVDDSKTCIAPRCLSLGCFATLEEVIEAIVDWLIEILVFLGIIALAAIIAIIIGLLGGILVPALVASNDNTGGDGTPSDSGQTLVAEATGGDGGPTASEAVDGGSAGGDSGQFEA